ncbi:hypothetical protein BD311DRAFT_758943 [Dichomitus squalens]|uniref:Uncharacterized protein n=1 Tax=Dichomitus squalens TaxID=114155 RepID=A0A4Q9ML30_9APHY|nr:hypothetical protein BD311DRAFT_758943 [Dichomitus squalens]
MGPSRLTCPPRTSVRPSLYSRPFTSVTAPRCPPYERICGLPSACAWSFNRVPSNVLALGSVHSCVCLPVEPAYHSAARIAQD